MVYLDTSVLGALFFREPGAASRAGADLATLDRRQANAAALHRTRLYALA